MDVSGRNRNRIKNIDAAKKRIPVWEKLYLEMKFRKYSALWWKIFRVSWEWEEYMDLDRRKKIANRAYDPYFREAGYCLASTFMISAILIIALTVFSIANNTDMIYLLSAILSLVIVLYCITIYRLSILALIERRKCDWKKAELTIENLSFEFSWADGKFEPTLPKLYPKTQEVRRVKLICKDQSNKKVVLHTVMSRKKWLFVHDRLSESLAASCTIYYGKFTRIVLFYKSNELWTDQLNHML